MDRIDRVELTITGWSSFDGIHTVNLAADVSDQNSPLVLAIRQAWRLTYDKMVDDGKGKVADVGGVFPIG